MGNGYSSPYIIPNTSPQYPFPHSLPSTTEKRPFHTSLPVQGWLPSSAGSACHETVRSKVGLGLGLGFRVQGFFFERLFPSASASTAKHPESAVAEGFCTSCSQTFGSGITSELSGDSLWCMLFPWVSFNTVACTEGCGSPAHMLKPWDCSWT